MDKGYTHMQRGRCERQWGALPAGRPSPSDDAVHQAVAQAPPRQPPLARRGLLSMAGGHVVSKHAPPPSQAPVERAVLNTRALELCDGRVTAGAALGTRCRQLQTALTVHIARSGAGCAPHDWCASIVKRTCRLNGTARGPKSRSAHAAARRRAATAGCHTAACCSLSASGAATAGGAAAGRRQTTRQPPPPPPPGTPQRRWPAAASQHGVRTHHGQAVHSCVAVGLQTATRQRQISNQRKFFCRAVQSACTSH